jgi:hypothetical protein
MVDLSLLEFSSRRLVNITDVSKDCSAVIFRVK